MCVRWYRLDVCAICSQSNRWIRVRSIPIDDVLMRLCVQLVRRNDFDGKIGKCQCADKVNTIDYILPSASIRTSHTHTHTRTQPSSHNTNRKRNLCEWRGERKREKEEEEFLEFRSFQNVFTRLSMAHSLRGWKWQWLLRWKCTS